MNDIITYSSAQPDGLTLMMNNFDSFLFYEILGSLWWDGYLFPWVIIFTALIFVGGYLLGRSRKDE